MKTAEQIAEKYINEHCWSGTKSDVIAALKEYGELVRQRAARVCEKMSPAADKFDSADAISQMELP